MRIAILTSARSGSTSMFHLIEDHLKHKKYISISEPFNNYWRDIIGLKTYDVDFFNDKDNLLIKTFVSKLERPKSFMDNEEGYWEWFFNYFDKVILLDRINKDLQSESLAYHLSKKKINSWQSKQYYDMNSIPKEEVENAKKILVDDSEKMHRFSGNGYPIFYFEDIFIEKNKDKLKELFEYIGLTLDDKLYNTHILSDRNIIRLKEKSTKLI